MLNSDQLFSMMLMSECMTLSSKTEKIKLVKLLEVGRILLLLRVPF